MKKSFEQLVRERKGVIEECEGFINSLVPDKDMVKLISLLGHKIKLYSNLECDNYAETLSDLEDIDLKIYNQVFILRNDKKLEYRSEIYKKYTELKETRNIYNFTKNLLNIKILKRISFLIRIIIFVIYFIFNKRINYLPTIDGFDIITISIELGIVGLTLLFMFYLFPAMHILIILIFYKDNDFYKNKHKNYIVYGTFILSMIALLIICFCEYIDKAEWLSIDKIEWLLSVFMVMPLAIYTVYHMSMSKVYLVSAIAIVSIIIFILFFYFSNTLALFLSVILLFLYAIYKEKMEIA